MRSLLVIGMLAFASFSACSGSATQTRPPDAVYVSANQLVFVESQVAAPANEAFQIYFENLEVVPHNVNVADGAGTSIARGEVFSGPAGRILDVPALAAGTYKLLCDVHPDMISELVAN